MNKKKWDKLPVGLIIGLIGPSLGFILYALYYSVSNDIPMSYFIEKVFFGNREMVAPIISLSLLFNIIPFYFFINRQFWMAGRGVLMSFFLYAIVIVYFRFF